MTDTDLPMDGSTMSEVKSEENCDHCWHSQSWLHAVYIPGGYHVDDYCCRCGKERCFSVVTQKPEEHGPFLKDGPT